MVSDQQDLPDKSQPEQKVNIRRMPFVYGETFPYMVARGLYISIPPSSPSGSIPPYWRYTSPANFLLKYGYLGPIVWLRRNIYHLLIINGHRVLASWTHSDYARVQVSEALFNKLHDMNMINLRKIKGKAHRQGFYGYIGIENKEEVRLLVQAVKSVYGI